ncbi:phytanoyl-CoA dioxygenase family protein [Skermanella mucosa]|uniref:phytanoyl-CoA dioxygenase family protein n=1 Tax=Skermanella mucosa TaxID=1789672 RepID=UPI001E2E36A8|nr:phytanoyl-CoA dioxygenase family protein [Skermanella mucosa]UEM23656.1 phytanoyl-CoA dioxygenase family protein [Skermanella mucosa]
MLSKEQIAEFRSAGYLVLPGFVSRSECQALLDYSRALAAQLAWEVKRMAFLPKLGDAEHEGYFLSSGDKIRIFFDQEQPAAGGSHDPAWRGVDKIGHALHDLDPLFDGFSRDPRLGRICDQVGMADPRLLQSMVIFKQAHTGGEIGNHQDAAWLYTEPQSVLGFWFALEDATTENGCLWVEPGGQRRGLLSRFRRRPEGGAALERLGGLDDFSTADFVPLEAEAGTMILMHGLTPHRSGPNRSPRPRGAYALHVIDGACHYPEDNWLQRPADMPLRGFEPVGVALEG